MKKRMNLRKKTKFKLVKILIILIVIILSFILFFKVFYNTLDIDLNNSTYLSYLVNDSFSHYNFSDISSLSSTKFLLKYTFGISDFDTGTSVSITTPVESDDTVSEPVIYVFNSHQSEEYQSNTLEDFNINNTVYIASHILKEYLDDLGLYTLVEENSIVDVLNANGWNYSSSYKASRILLESAYQDNQSLNFFIDLHRDSSSYERTTAVIDEVSYAKIMFVVGLENENYQENLDLANKLNDLLINVNANLSRGVLEKKGVGVNGVYNQDFNKNTVLIEVGGQYNSIEEVNNTLKIFASCLYDYLKGEE